MNKKRPVIPFLSGVLATVLTMGCVTTTLAASGLVQFSPVGLQLNGKAIFAAGDSVNTENGQSVPSSIVYTDEAGGGTTYLPLRTIANLLDVPITWDGTETTVVLGRGDGGGITVEPGTGASAWDSLPLHQAGKTAGPFAEVQPDARKGGIMLLEETHPLCGRQWPLCQHHRNQQRHPAPAVPGGTPVCHGAGYARLPDPRRGHRHPHL